MAVARGGPTAPNLNLKRKDTFALNLTLASVIHADYFPGDESVNSRLITGRQWHAQ